MKYLLVCVVLAVGVMSGFAQERKSKEAILATAKRAVEKSDQVDASANAAFRGSMELNEAELSKRKEATALVITNRERYLDSMERTTRLRPEQVFISQYGIGYHGLAQVTPARYSSYHEYLTPIAYVDLNHVTNQLELFLRTEFGYKLKAGSLQISGQKYQATYQTEFGAEALTFTFEMGTYGGLFYAKNGKITGDENALINFYVRYWHTPFYLEEKDQDYFFTTNHKLDRVRLLTDLSAIMVTAKPISESEFADLIDEYR